MTGESKITTDHEIIRKWAEERSGRPAEAAPESSAEEELANLLRINFLDPGPGYAGDKTVSWEDFFVKFEAAKLAFLYQELGIDGKISRFHKFVEREELEEPEERGTYGEVNEEEWIIENDVPA